jgi:hypothetical protein
MKEIKKDIIGLIKKIQLFLIGLLIIFRKSLNPSKTGCKIPKNIIFRGPTRNWLILIILRSIKV